MSYTSEPTRRNGGAEEVKQSLSELKQDAGKALGSAKAAARNAIEEGRHKLEDVRDTALERAQTIFTQMENQVRTRPAAALGAALGAGLLLGLMMAGRRHRH